MCKYTGQNNIVQIRGDKMIQIRDDNGKMNRLSRPLYLKPVQKGEGWASPSNDIGFKNLACPPR